MPSVQHRNVEPHLPNPALLRRTGRTIQHHFANATWHFDWWREEYEAPRSDPQALTIDIEQLAAFLGVLTFALAASERVNERGYATVEQVEIHAQEWVPEALIASGMTSGEIIDATLKLVSALGRPCFTPPSAVGTAMREIRGVVASFVRGIPISALLELSDAHGNPVVAHTVRTRAEKLRAIYFRMGAPINGPFKVLAQAWEAGGLELDVAAEILHLNRSDLVAALETHGYERPVERVVLDDTKAGEALAKLRRDRLARGGRPVPKEDLVTRDVIATQRIEGIEAQRWLPQSP